MLQEETLQSTGRRTYEEPDGEFLELIGSGSNTITVLTRTNTDKGVGRTILDPSDYSVNELEKELAEKVETEGLTDEERTTLIEAEKAGKDRTTAKGAIKNA